MSVCKYVSMHVCMYVYVGLSVCLLACPSNALLYIHIYQERISEQQNNVIRIKPKSCTTARNKLNALNKLNKPNKVNKVSKRNYTTKQNKLSKLSKLNTTISAEQTSIRKTSRLL